MDTLIDGHCTARLWAMDKAFLDLMNPVKGK